MNTMFEATSREDLHAIWPTFSPPLHPVTEFYGNRGKYKCFSNFYEHEEIPFTIPDCCWNSLIAKGVIPVPRTVQVTFSEKSLMLCKAAAMGDMDSYRKISSCSRPNEAKKLGRRVQNFQEGVWQSVLLTVGFEAVYQKFCSLGLLRNNELSILLSTNNSLIVEAAPGDFIWGIGYPTGHPYCRDPSRWGSGNVLGFALMKARKSLVDADLLTPRYKSVVAKGRAGRGGGVKLPVGMSADKVNGTGYKSKSGLRKERKCVGKNAREAEKKLKKKLRKSAKLKAEDSSSLSEEQKKMISMCGGLTKELVRLGL